MRKANGQTLLFLSLLIIAALAACRKDEPLPCIKESEKPCCDDFPDMWSSWIWESRFQYKAPYFNPNNSNEFVFYYKDWDLDKHQLVKYNLLTHQKTVLANNVKIISQPKWNSKGWIAFDNEVDFQIWKLKENGDSLFQSTSSTFNFFPAWSSSGNKLYWQYTPVRGVPYYFLRQELNGATVDTLMRLGDAYDGYTAYNDVSVNDWLVSEMVFAPSQNIHIGYADLTTSGIIFKSVVNSTQIHTQGISGMCWSHDGQSIYTSIVGSTETLGPNGMGLFNFNIATGAKKRILCFCDSKMYNHLSCSPDGKYLIAERVDLQLTYDPQGNLNLKIIRSSSISLIDLQTNIETQLNLE